MDFNNMVYDLTRENQIYDGNIEIDGEDLPGVTKFKCNGFMFADDNRLLRELNANLDDNTVWMTANEDRCPLCSQHER